MYKISNELPELLMLTKLLENDLKELKLYYEKYKHITPLDYAERVAIRKRYLKKLNRGLKFYKYI